MTDFENRSPIRVAVQRDFMRGIAITFALRIPGDGYNVMHFGEGDLLTIRWEHADEGIRIDQPTFSIEEEFARELYEQLGHYFQGQPTVTTQRADYLHERGRVDKLIEVISKIALDVEQL
jgi:hypothetical protein